MTENRAGKGKAVYYGSFFNLDAARYLLDRYTREQKVQPLLSGIPKPVEVTRRTRGDTNYYFILNHANGTVTVSPGAGFTDLIEGTPAPSGFPLKAFEYRVLKKR